MTVLCRIRLQIPWWYDRPMWCLFRRCLCTYCLLVESIRITIYPHQLYNPNKSRRECLQHMCETSPFLCKRDLASCAWRCSAISYCWQWHDQMDMSCVLERSKITWLFQRQISFWPWCESYQRHIALELIEVPWTLDTYGW